MGTWFHTERSSFGDYFAAALARARSPEPWRKTDRDVSLFRGIELLRALTLAQMTGSVSAQPATEGNPIATMTIAVGQSPSQPDRAAAVRLLMATDVIYSRGQVDDSSIETFSNAGDVGALQVALIAGVAVVALGGLAFLGYTVHRTADVIDHNQQREADMAKLKEADAQALELVKRHADREALAGKPLAIDDATKQALSGLAKVQELIAQKQSVDPASPPFSFFGLSLPELGGVAALAAGAIWLFAKK